MNKLLIVGPLPQNNGIGGVSIHVQRLLDFLKNNHFTFNFIDYKISSKVKLLRSIRSCDVIHVHISNPIYQFIFVLLCIILQKRVIVTLHGDYGRFGWFRNMLVRVVIHLATIPVVINTHSYNACKRINNKTQLISAFIPPQKEVELQHEIITLLDRLHSKGKMIVSTNAFNVSFDKKGNDIYGIDFLVRFFQKSVNYTLLVSDPSGNQKKRFHELISDSVIFINYPHSLYQLLKHVDYFVRNTSTDGDALSVKEALYLGVTTLCSNVVDRPDGVLLFKYSDEISFESALSKKKERNFVYDNAAIKLLELYRNII